MSMRWTRDVDVSWSKLLYITFVDVDYILLRSGRYISPLFSKADPWAIPVVQ